MRLVTAASALLATAVLAAAPAFAIDAVTYKGTLGKYEILAELVASREGVLVGRYSYLAKGGDIPLGALDDPGTAILMLEEAPCTETTCPPDGNGQVIDPPQGGIWSVTPSADGDSLTGTWEATGQAGKPLAIALQRIGQRTLPEGTDTTPAGIRDSAMSLLWAGERSFQPDTAPYEFAKQEVPFGIGPHQELEGSTFRYVTDPRSKFAFPRVLELVDGSPIDPVNRALEIQHTVFNTYAFDCLSQIYAGFGATQNNIGSSAGTLGDYDSESIEVNYLSPTVMSWTESGSTFCGGAHPNNHSDSYNLDVRTGETLALAKIFKDWLPTASRADYSAEVDVADAMEWPGDYYWSAGQDLIHFAIARRPIDSDATYEEECGFDELIASSLAIRFAPGDAAVFRLEGLPHAIGPCGGDLLTIKLGDTPELLAPTASDYFPDLAQ